MNVHNENVYIGLCSKRKDRVNDAYLFLSLRDYILSGVNNLREIDYK